MKLLKDKYTLSLNEVSRMFETGDYSILKRWRWVPGWLLKRHYEIFLADFAQMYNRETVNQLFEDDIMRLKIVNLATNLLPLLYNGLLFTEQPYFRELYKNRYGHDYNGIEDLTAIITEINKLGHRLKVIQSPVAVVQEKESMKFEEVIGYVELILERSIDREMKLYQFAYQYRIAVKRAEEMGKIKTGK